MKTKLVISKAAIAPVAIAFLMFLGMNSFAQKEKLQTAFIYQLTRLIEWCPDGKTGNFIIGVVGNNPNLVTELGALKFRKVGEQPIEVKSFATLADVTKTNILFLPATRSSDVKEALNIVGTDCTLIISDQEGGVDMGAGVSIIFLEESSKIQYEISKKYMTKHSLNVNDQLYKLATKTY